MFACLLFLHPPQTPPSHVPPWMLLFAFPYFLPWRFLQVLHLLESLFPEVYLAYLLPEEYLQRSLRPHTCFLSFLAGEHSEWRQDGGHVPQISFGMPLIS